MRVPVATYRLQINDAFTLDDARNLVPWLARLGITDVYLSPVFEARRGSTHGYDVTDPTRVRASIGGPGALARLAGEAQRHHMGIVLDIVPNHMAASSENPWWRDVLEQGRASQYARFFDVDWNAGPLALPILGDAIERVLERGEMTIAADGSELIYHETRLPIASGTATDDVAATLRQQQYQLVPWWTASEQMTYRRFFDITDLAGVRVEDRAVFEATHALVRELAADGIITGLRIDHIDGLRDPAGYLHELREFVRDPDGGPVFTLVEKILESSELLPADWECEGTTGYEFLSLAGALLIAPEGQAQIDAFYRRVTGDTRHFDELVREKKLLVMERLFGGELRSLALALARLVKVEYGVARRAIAELTASMDVYRTYTREWRVSPADRRRIEEAVSDAVQRATDRRLEAVLEALRRIVLLESPEQPAGHLDWVMRWQQFTGPVMAKGFEDTALYCHNALLAANDVGTDPARPCLADDELHAALQRRLQSAALSLNATATHDTKRGEDTRARIAVLSELPDEWRARLRRWMRQGDEWKNEIAEEEETVAPSADVESLLYQTLLGAWPLDGVDDGFRSRIHAYMMKAVREAKEQTSWRRPDEDYELALTAFIERLMAEFGREGLAEDVGTFAQRLAPHGALNAMAQMLLKATAPGIPDFYQGTELWSFTLVDPDNRAPIDFAARRSLFDEVASLRDSPDPAPARALLTSWQDGRIKLLLTAHALRFRAMHRDVFEQGEYTPLPATGPEADHVFAFARRLNGRACITVLPRRTVTLGESPAIDPALWRDTRVPLPPGLRNRWHNALTGEITETGDTIQLRALFASVPFALLEVSQPIGG
ncbi:MAG TPA: malto-oligosyltrehalose synthase [Longimicrobiales bacterium]